ncbi:MAG: hypothetical protein R3F19_16155 [Verrucomicrobiales bacterium]
MTTPRHTWIHWMGIGGLALLSAAAGWMCVPAAKSRPGPDARLPPAPVQAEAPDTPPPTLDRLWELCRQLDEDGSGGSILREIDRLPTIDDVQAMIDEGVARFRRWQTNPVEEPSEHDGEALYVVWKVLVARFAEMDALRAFEHGMQVAGGDGALPSAVFIELVKQHPERIETIAADFQQQYFRSSLRSLLSAADLLADRDPELALRLYEYLEPGDEDRAGSFFARWAERAPSEVIERAASLTEPRRKVALETTARTWAQTDGTSALQWAQVEDPKNADGLLGTVIGTIARRDPPRAARLALELSIDDPPMLAEIRNQWLRRDLDSAFTWLLSLRDPVLQERFLGRYMDVPDKDLERSIGWLQQFPLNQTVAFAYEHVVSQLSTSNLHAAVEWLKTSDRVEALATARGKVLHEWADRDAIAAVDYVEQHLDLITNPETAAMLADRLARLDPARAFEWASRLPSEELRQEATAAMMRVATSGDPIEALPLALALEPGQTRSATLSNVVFRMAQDGEPGATVAWLSSLPDLEQRELAPMLLRATAPTNTGILLQNPVLYDASGALTKEAKLSLDKVASNM